MEIVRLLRQVTMKVTRLNEDPTQCLWCAKKVGSPIEVQVAAKRETYVATVCSPACEKAAISALEFVRIAIPRFLIGMVTGLALLLASEWLDWGGKGIATGVFVIGLSATLWPMVTPQTVEILGMKRAFVAGRVVGTAAIVVAVWLGWKLG